MSRQRYLRVLNYNSASKLGTSVLLYSLTDRRAKNEPSKTTLANSRPSCYVLSSSGVDPPLCQVSHSLRSSQPSHRSDKAVSVESRPCRSSGCPAFSTLVEERRPQSHPGRRVGHHIGPSGPSRGVRGWSPWPLRRAVHIEAEGSHCILVLPHAPFVLFPIIDQH